MTGTEKSLTGAIAHQFNEWVEWAEKRVGSCVEAKSGSCTSSCADRAEQLETTVARLLKRVEAAETKI